MPKKVGFMPCNGMSFIMSTVARDVCRTVAEAFLPGQICLIDITRILAEVEEEMKIVRKVPIMVIDGCRVKCASKALEKRQLIFREVIIITDIMRDCGLSLRGEDRNRLGCKGRSIVTIVSRKVTQKATRLLDRINEQNR